MNKGSIIKISSLVSYLIVRGVISETISPAIFADVPFPSSNSLQGLIDSHGSISCLFLNIGEVSRSG